MSRREIEWMEKYMSQDRISKVQHQRNVQYSDYPISMTQYGEMDHYPRPREGNRYYIQHDTRREDTEYKQWCRRKEGRKRQKRIGIVLLLLVAALITAFIIGLILYFIILDAPGSSNQDYHTATMSAPLLNKEYSLNMGNLSSVEAQVIVDPFCTEIDRYFEKSDVADRYIACNVQEIRRSDDSPVTCSCEGHKSASKGNRAVILFDLTFEGVITEIEILNVLDTMATKEISDGFSYLKIGKFVIDVSTTIDPPPFVIPDSGIDTVEGVKARITAKPLNLTWNDELQRNTSTSFIVESQAICSDLDTIFLESPLKDRYYDCQVKMFGNQPARIIVDIRLMGTAYLTLKNHIIQVLMTETKYVTHEDQNYRMIGRLLVDPFLTDISDLTDVVIDINHITPGPLRPISTAGTDDFKRAVDITVHVYDLTFDLSLLDSTSSLYLAYSNAFCHEIEELYNHANITQTKCNIEELMAPDQTSEFARIKFRLQYRQSYVFSVDQFRFLIKMNAPKTIHRNKITGHIYYTYKVGFVLIILNKATFYDIGTSKTISVSDESPETSYSTLTLYPMSSAGSSESSPIPKPSDKYTADRTEYTHTIETFANLLSSSFPVSYSTLSTPLSLFTDKRHTLDIVDTLMLSDSLTSLVTPSADGISMASKGIGDFSTVVDSVDLSATPYSEIISQNSHGDTPSSLSSVVDVYTKTTNFSSLDVHLSKGTYLSGSFSTSAGGSGITQSVVTSTEQAVYDATYIYMTYGLYDFNYTYDLVDRYSSRFTKLQSNFCSEINMLMNQMNIGPFLEKCEILSFRESPSGIDFGLTISSSISEYLVSDILDAIDNMALHKVENSHRFFVIGDLKLISNVSEIHMNMTNINFHQSAFSIQPSITPPLASSLTKWSSDVTSSSEFLPTSTQINACRVDQFNCVDGTCIEWRYRCDGVMNCPDKSDELVSTCGTAPLVCPEGLYRCNDNRCVTGTECDGIVDCHDGSDEHVDICDLICKTNPCGNEGQCVEQQGSYKCQCKDGWRGQNCNQVDICSTMPCENALSCVHSPEPYFCNCKPGWRGQNCTEKDNCQGNPCQNGGQCISTVDSYFCTDCTAGWRGHNCTEVDLCHFSPCRNGGECHQTSTIFHCECLPGWRGHNCAEEDFCNSNPCGDRGKCTSTLESFLCECYSDWIGPDCSDVNPCFYNPCANEGSCQIVLGMPKCTCDPEWKGTNCTELDLCFNNPCAHEGTCQLILGIPECTCKSGWRGSNCTEIDYCYINTCENEGECISTSDSFVCNCKPGWRGRNCELTDNCFSSPCGNDGQCISTVDSFVCRCKHGWRGQTCDIEDFCHSNPCGNRGKCVNTEDSYVCECYSNWMGQDCSEVDLCFNNPCAHEGTCQLILGIPECTCKSGWRGSNCTEIDYCYINTCENDGECISTSDSFVCNCKPGWRGRNCELNDVCYRNPCSNNGSCITLESKYECVCQPGWYGQNCTSPDVCFDNPCKNDGECINADGSYKCTCLPQWVGQNCTEELSCHGNPCFNGGICVETETGYLCRCPPKWRGQNCTEVNETKLEFSFLATNLTWTATLSNISSSEFQFRTNLFCSDIDRILGKYPDIAVYSKGCSVTSFQNNPQSVQWQLVYPGLKQSEFQVSINNAIFSDLPHVISRGVEGVVIGDMLIHYKNIVTTSLSLELIILNLTWTEELTDIHSQVFHRTSSSVSKDIDELMRNNTIDFPSYIESSISEFKSNPTRIVVGLTFEGSLNGKDLTDKLFRIVKTDKPKIRYKNTLGYMLGELLVFSENYTNLTIIPVTFRVLNMTWTDDLLNMSAADTQRYTQQIIRDVDSFLSKSDLIHYESSRVTTFRNNPATLSLELQFDGIHDVMEYRNRVVHVIEHDSPTVSLQGNTVNLVGGLLLYHGDFKPIIQVNETKLEFNYLTTNLSWTAALTNKTSAEFQIQANLFCSDIDKILGKYPTFANFSHGCKVLSFKNNPKSVQWQLVYRGLKQSEFQVSINNAIFSDLPHVISRGVEGVVIGDMLIYYKNIVTTSLSLELMILNMTWTEELTDIQSPIFHRISSSVSTDVDSIMKENSNEFPSYIDSSITTFRNNPIRMVIELIFEGSLNGKDMADKFLGVVKTDKRIFRYRNSLGYMLGELLVFSENYTNLTIIPVTFRILNMTWTDDLLNMSAADTQRYTQQIIRDVDSFLSKSDLIHYESSRVTTFRNNPATLSLELQFDGIHDVMEYRNRVVHVIEHDAPTVSLQGNTVNLVGGLLLYHGDFKPIIQVNETKLEFNYLTTNLSWTAALTNKTSAEFQIQANLFCSDIDKILGKYPTFANFSHGCKVLSFKKNPKSVQWQLVYRGLKQSEFQVSINNAIFSDLQHVISRGVEGVVIGDMLIYYKNIVTTSLSLELMILNMTWTEELTDIQSPIFHRISSSVSTDVDSIMKENSNEFPSYIDSSITTFRNNPIRMVIELMFEGSLNGKDMADTFLGVVKTDKRIFRYRNTLGYMLGELLVFSENYTNLTIIPVTFRVLNMTWTDDLLNMSAADTQRYTQQIIRDVDSFLSKSDLIHYESSRVTTFRNNPATVSLELQFDGIHDVMEYRNRVVHVIEHDAPTVSLQGNTVNLVGGLLLYHGDFKPIIQVNETKLEFNYLTTNLSWTAALTNKTSAEFQIQANLFCSDIDKILGKYPTFATFSHGCKVLSFKNNPKSVQWQLVYRGLKQSEFQVSINNAIFSDLPHVISRGVEGVVIGDMLIHYKNIVTTSLSLELMILNMTWTEELTDIQSPIFHRISSSVSTDVDSIMKENSNEFPSYIDSSITTFRNNPIRMVIELIFEGSLNGKDMADKFLGVVKTDKRIFRYRNSLGYMLGELLVFSENYTNLTIIPVTFRVLNMTWTDDFLNMSAADTQIYTQHITRDVDRLLFNSDLIHYESAKVMAFGNSPVTVSLALQFDGIHNVMEYRNRVVNVIEQDAPKVSLQGNTVNLVGGVLLYHGEFKPIIQLNETRMEFSYLATNLTWTDALKDESSKEFQIHANSFCSDINAILVRYPGIADFSRGCKVISFQNHPKSIQWQLVYPGLKQSEFQVSINNAIFSDLPHVISRGVEGVVIGGMLIHYKNIVTTSLSLELMILNLTWTEDLTDIQSPVFHRISSSVSIDVESIIKENSNEFPPYIESRIIMFRNNPIRMVIELMFEGSFQGKELTDKLLNVVKTDKRMYRYRNTLGYMLGELLVFSENYTNLTIIPVTFRVLNMTWADDLLNMSAADTQRYTQHITSDVDNLLSKSSSDFIHYETSRVTAFRNNPVRVSLELQFDGIHDVTTYRHRVVNVIERDTPKVFMQGNTANLVGGLLLYHGDFRPIIHDAWKSNITFFITEFMYYPQYQNHRSQLFLEFEEAFCDEISNYISRSDLRSRYYRCLFEKIGDTPIHTLTFNLIFNGTENVLEHDVIDTITTHAIQFPGNLWYIADKLVYPGMFQNIAVNISDYLVSISPRTTTGPEGFTIINATFVTLNNTQVAGLKDPTSSAFRERAEPFCNELNQIYRNVTITKKMYDGCEVKSFSMERKTQKITFVLKFRGQLEGKIRNELFEILLEKAARADVNGGITTIRIGTLLIYEESLNNYVTRRDVPSTTTAAPGICDGTKEYVADPANCRIFIFCAGQMSLQCPNEYSFSEEKNSCVPDSSCH